MEQDDLLKKWLNNELTESEKALFSNQEDFALNQKIIDSAQFFKASDHTNIKDFEAFKKDYQNRETTKLNTNWYKPYLRIAAILVVALGVYFSFFFNSTTTINTQIAEKTTIELPDHSQVTLNALSSLKYKEKNWDENRNLNLNGEAYFKVAKGKTFNVVTTIGTVTVVGTEFNVKNREDYFEVHCFEGIVKVKSDTIIRQLIAGNTFKIYKGRFSEGQTDLDSPNWSNNKSNFENIEFSDVLGELERQYNIQITTDNIDLKRLFSGAFTHINLENALLSITKPMNLSYKWSSKNSVVIYEMEN
ncbi:FecR family protein [Xanthomarina spongicola]|uniref:FecR family protein n=1 Tax=Xanthomarina spongicola TaxID=570520 RepID=A0A316E9P7_9FLAO|nr:FecR family protein [Xanthomarina spongicola]PWK19600.1 FecR family protein [Xanthomarina spongicola]